MQVLPRITEGKHMKITHTDSSDEAIERLLEDERFKELVEGIELFDGMKLRLWSKEDVNDLMTSPHLLSDLRLPPIMCVLEKYFTDEGYEHPTIDQAKIDPIMRNGVLSLRLLKGGNIRAGPLLFVNVSGERHLVARSGSQEPLPEWHERPYELTFDEVSSLKKILERVQRIDFSKQRNLKIACKRFERAILERDPEHKLIDLMIAFEALFWQGRRAEKSDRTKSTKRRIVEACSDLLGKNFEEREEIKHYMTKAFRIRNRIVHGSEQTKPIRYKQQGYWLPAFAWKIEDYLRRSIKKKLEFE